MVDRPDITKKKLMIGMPLLRWPVEQELVDAGDLTNCRKPKDIGDFDGVKNWVDVEFRELREDVR